MALKSWVITARPKTLAASFSPVIVGALLAPSLNGTILFFTLVFALSIQIGTNLANDYFDYFQGADTSQRKGPIRACASGLISPKKVKWAFLLSFLFAFLCSSYLSLSGGPLMFWTGVLSVFLGIFYTATPYSIAYLGLAEIFVLLFFGSVASFGSYYLQTQKLSLFAFIMGLGPGFISSALLVSNNLRDEEEDAIAGKKTLVVRFGRSFGKAEYLFFLLSSPLFFIVASLLGYLSFHFVFFFLLYIPLFFLLKNKVLETENLLEKTAPFLGLYTLFFLFIKLFSLIW